MLWSLIKIILFIGIVAGLTYGVGILAETSGGIRVSFGQTELNLDPLRAAVVAVLLVLAIWIGLKLLSLLVAVFRFINGDETAISRYFNRNRERKGFEALADGMTALALGEGRLAMSKAAKAEKYLSRPELTNLISAQAAEISGDRQKAEEVYKRLLQDDRTRFLGVRGIMKQKLEDGDTETAMLLAQKAFALKPNHAETGDVLLRLQADNEDWKGARATLSEKLRQGVLPRDVHKRRDAVLALSEAREVFRDGSTVEAREAAIEANRLSPDLIPAAVMAAQAYITANKARNATRILKKAWDAHPHPDLAAAFASIFPDEDPNTRIKRFAKLTKSTPDHSETKMLNAELYIATKDYSAARSALGDLIESDPTARSLAIMAAIERGEGSEEAVVRGWLAKAVTASRGPQWVCSNCQTVHSIWAPVCNNCSGFDTMTWSVPENGEVAMPASTEMLPLIVGEIENEVDDVEIVEDDPLEETAIVLPAGSATAEA
ncbi:MAG: heme biosynthesis HemY N-terminal domain-containing protein [Paracoccaceae bacterium]